MYRKIFVCFLVLLLVACGGGGGGDSVAGIGGTGAPADKTTGTITGFGSIFVNGIEFETTGSEIIIDGVPGSEVNLKLGMVVNISGDFDSASGIGNAVTVEFDDSVQGPVMGITTHPDGMEKTLAILGITVTVVDGVTIFEGVSFGTLAISDLLEVSGYFDTSGELHATRVEKKSGSEIELKASITSVDLGTSSFTLGAFTVDYSAADLSALPGSEPVTGMRVEVKGSLSGTTINATEVEVESSFFGEDEESVSLEGFISAFNSSGPTFTISGQNVDASAAVLSPASLVLADDIKVEVEGSLVGGVLQASSIEARQGELEIHAVVQSISGQTVTLTLGNGQNISFAVDSQTSFDDKTEVLEILTLSDIDISDYLKVKLVDTGSAYLATDVARDELDKERIQGPVDNFISGSSITVLGITFSVDGGTSYENALDQIIPDSGTFFSMLTVGALVKIEDESPFDGVADEVEFE